jgi:lipopolysaccharide transport system ATP-binding protein
MMRQVKGFGRKALDMARGRQILQGDEVEEFWALKDVSFDVQPGEVVGIIGRNGAGKSTLLKILSRITEPTEGRVRLGGRVASLLEVGTGFHPELTGRENVFLNGAILGMTRAEIKNKFDEIVAFAEVEKFLDTPVKRYSSGMYVRLAFAVAAHLEPEILVVDEVLAVGDVAFQKKCLGKMDDVAKEGRTVLFVSHNMAAVSSLCTKAMVLKEGCMLGHVFEVDKAIEVYLSHIKDKTTMSLADRKDRKGEGRIKITDFSMIDKEGKEVDMLVSGQYVEFRIYYECIKNLNTQNISIGIGIFSHLGQFLALLGNEMVQGNFDSIAQKGYCSCEIRKLPIAPMRLNLNLIIRQNNIIQDWIIDAVTVTVEKGNFYGTGRVTESSHGGFLIEQLWFTNRGRE